MKSVHEHRFNRIAAGVALAFASIATPPAFAATTVTNCNDSGVGSLRQAVLNAPEGGTVDMTHLLMPPVDPSCSASTITLETGSIVVMQNSLTINGPGMDRLTLTSDPRAPLPAVRSFEHDGNGTSIDGTLNIAALTLSGGFIYSNTSNAIGGCIYSKENVALTNVRVTGCYAHVGGTGSHVAGAAGIYTAGSLSLRDSIVSGNKAVGRSATSQAASGGAFAEGSLYMFNSTVSGNSAAGTDPSDQIGHVGGIGAHHGANIRYSVISGNRAGQYIGGFYIANGYEAKIADSTISGNSSPNGPVGGGYIANVSNVYIYNSTIAFNTAAIADEGNHFYAAGIAIEGHGAGSTQAVSVTLQSSILSNNTYGALAVGYDLSISPTSLQGPVTVGGSNNLVLHSSASLPGDTKHVCPLLGPLRDNGGATFTHALLSHSPAIDMGLTSFDGTDQRGTGFTRESPTGYPDIGAYEVQKNDIVFDAGFDGCP